LPTPWLLGALFLRSAGVCIDYPAWSQVGGQLTPPWVPPHTFWAWAGCLPWVGVGGCLEIQCLGACRADAWVQVGTVCGAWVVPRVDWVLRCCQVPSNVAVFQTVAWVPFRCGAVPDAAAHRRSRLWVERSAVFWVPGAPSDSSRCRLLVAAFPSLGAVPRIVAPRTHALHCTALTAPHLPAARTHAPFAFNAGCGTSAGCRL